LGFVLLLLAERRVAAIGIRVAALAALIGCAIAAAATPQQTTGSLVAYAHEGTDGRYRVWVTVAEFAARQLPLGKEAAFTPRWSSDGRRLLFARPSGIYVATTSGAGLSIRVERTRRIARVFTEWGLDWSPDGTSIALALDPRPRDRRSCTELYTMRSDGSRLRRLSATAECELDPAWSPDGLEIAFERQGDERTEIVVTDARGRNQRILGEGTFPAWAPDGRSLAFLTRETIQVVDPVTGAVQRSLKPDVQYDRLENGLAWSPDGTRLVHGFHDLQETFPLTHLAVIDADGSNSLRLTTLDTFPDMEPDWRPICDIYGTNGDDLLTGTPGDDLICGLRGNDRIHGGGGNDTILGGDGNDSIAGGAGTDRLFGASGNDRLYALDGKADVVNGGPGRDRMWGDEVDTVSEIEERHG
jgi:Tol biopolymer transport system component